MSLLCILLIRCAVGSPSRGTGDGPSPRAVAECAAPLLRNADFAEPFAPCRLCTKDGRLAMPVGDSEEDFLVLGDAAWREVETRFQVCRRNQVDGLTIVMKNTAGERFRLVLGAKCNSTHELVRETGAGIRQTVCTAQGGTEIGRWQVVRLQCRAHRVKVWLGQRLLFDCAGGSAPFTGRIQVGSLTERLYVRGITMKSPQGKVLQSHLPSPAKHWRVVGRAQVELEPGDRKNESASLKITSAGRLAGIEQPHLDAHQDQRISGQLRVCGRASDGLLLRLVDGTETLAQTVLAIPADRWRAVPFELLPCRDTKGASLQILTQGQASVLLDRIQVQQPNAYGKAIRRPKRHSPTRRGVAHPCDRELRY